MSNSTNNNIFEAKVEAQIETNVKAQQEIEEAYKMVEEWREIWRINDWTDLISIFRLKGGACVKCGGDITASNLQFFNFDVERVMCYECQNSNK